MSPPPEQPAADPLALGVDQVRRGLLSARSVVDRTLEGIQQGDPRLNAFVHLDQVLVREAADRIDALPPEDRAALPLAGGPIAIKDNICTTFAPTTCASRMLAGHRPVFDATVIERLVAAGAIPTGKTNMDEFAMGSSTELSYFGPASNPWDPARVAGGSSGGSAAAVAARLVPAALGSDTGGSIRQPASFCGVVGLKPTYGRVSRHGLIAYGSSLDQVGPLTTTVIDAALLLQVIAGHDPRDATSAAHPVPDYLAATGQGVEGLRVGLPAEFMPRHLDVGVRQAVEAALETWRSAGVQLVPLNLPRLRHATAAYYTIAVAEASSNLARYDGIRFGHRARGGETFEELVARSRGEGFGPAAKRRIMLGTYVLSGGYHDAYYLKAARVRTLICRELAAAFADVDLIASPTTPTAAFRLGEKLHDPLAMYLCDIYTLPANLAGLPAISLPAGFDDGGLPIGVQLMASPFREDLLLAAGHALQLRTDFHQRIP